MDEIKQIKPELNTGPRKIKLDTGGEEKEVLQKEKREMVINKMVINKGKRRIRIGRVSPRLKKRLRLGGLGLGLFLIIFFFLAVMSVFATYRRGRKLMDRGYALKASFEAQDINQIESSLGELERELESFEKSYKRLSWMRLVPKLGGYWKDGAAGIRAGKYGIETAEIVIETVKPYADIIGFVGGGEQAQSGEESANDRIEFLVQTIEEILPKMDEISEKMKLANEEINKINTNRYPEKFRGKEIRGRLESLVALTNEMTTMVVEGKPLMEAAPYLLGMDGTRTYLVLFQNDKELRPTGGFITAYSIMDVRNGKLEPVSSSDIYNLDNSYTPSVEAPGVIIDYLQGPYKLNENLRLRDMNWYPDFAESMELFTTEAESVGIDEIDGVIAVDTYVVVYLLEVIGQIGVPGFGNFSADIDDRCDCPQVVYELESFADVEGPVVWSENEPGKIVFAPPNYDNRKKIVGPLMNSVISNAMGQEKAKLPDLFMAAWKAVTEKHVLVYLFDEKAQKGAEGFNIAGRIRDYEGDYLHINDANLGGRKSNLYVTQEVSQEIEVSRDGSVEKILSVTYKNPKEYDGWLNSVLPNWTRIYVPKGSELVSVEGFDEKMDPYEEYGKTVFSGGFELRPQGVKKIVVRYKLPFKMKKNYNLLVQKQPGLDGPLYTINLGKKSEEQFLWGDKEFKFGL